LTLQCQALAVVRTGLGYIGRCNIGSHGRQ
jgi:hypothetical protein